MKIKTLNVAYEKGKAEAKKPIKQRKPNPYIRREMMELWEMGYKDQLEGIAELDKDYG